MDIKPEDLKATRIIDYGSHQWAIVHGPTGTNVSAPAELIDHPELGQTVIMGARIWRRKKDAQAIIDAYTERYYATVDG